MLCREEKHEQSKTLESHVGDMSSGSVGSGEWKKGGKRVMITMWKTLSVN